MSNIYRESVNKFGIKLSHPNEQIGNQHVQNLITIPSMNALERWMRNAEEERKTSKKRYSKDSFNVDSSGWAGTKDLNEWYDVMHNGDAKVIAKIKKSKEKSLQQLGGYTPKGYTFDVEGEFFDIGEVLANKPECWLNPILDEEVKEITVKISTSGNGSVRADDIIDGAGHLLGMVAKLESEGYKVKLENILFSRRVDKAEEENLMCSVTVKDFNDHINFAKMSAIVSPALQRRGTFMLKEELLQEDLAYGYGQTKPVDGITTIHNKNAMRELQNKLFKKDN